jgi:hypothetical protein
MRAPTAASYVGREMAIAMLVDSPEGTQEAYERVRARLGQARPEGGIFHFAGPGPNGGWRVVEVWESEEEASRFFLEHFVPALRAAGFEGPPPARQLWPVHNALR